MKKTLVAMCVLSAFVFASSAGAVDRSPKSNEKEEKKKPAQIEEMTKEKAKEKSRSEALTGKTVRGGEGKYQAVPKKTEPSKKQSDAQRGSERYDYFQDSNNNGVDDRLEKKEKRVKKEEARLKEKPAVTPERKAPAKVAPASPQPVSPKPEKAKEPAAKERKKEVEPKKVEPKKPERKSRSDNR
jgi:hypothetical protein